MHNTDPLALLPQAPGEESAVTLNKTQKSLLNRALYKAGYHASIAPDALYTDWANGSTVFRVFHGRDLNYVVRLDGIGEGQSRTPCRGSDADDPSKLVDAHSRVQGPSRGYRVQHPTLRDGMIVRIPFDIREGSEDFREYYIGKIADMDPVSDTLTVELRIVVPGEPVVVHLWEGPQVFVHRCHVLPGTRCTHESSGRQGLVLCPTDYDWQDDEYCFYYIQIGDQVVRTSESDLVIDGHRGDPDPHFQAKRYEFHNPSFKSPRDRLVESHAELQAAAFGIEDLVGARVHLLPHQAKVVAEVLGDSECRYMLADEVGLGKTIEACVILKGLRHRHPDMRALVVAPAALIAQWYFELDHKFWTRFAICQNWRKFLTRKQVPSLIVSSEDLEREADLVDWLMQQHWGLLIIDEAHHMTQRRALAERLQALSAAAERALVLTATPIQRRAKEFLALLQLMNPRQYGAMTLATFDTILSVQQQLLKRIAAVEPDLSEAYFDSVEFVTNMRALQALMPNDDTFSSLVGMVEEAALNSENGLEAAREALAYIKENYRVERRVVRNRRANLQLPLPKRVLVDSYSYLPDRTERSVLDGLHNYIDRCLDHWGNDLAGCEYARLLLHAAFSSPQALQRLLEFRLQKLKTNSLHAADVTRREYFVTSGAPREESKRISSLLVIIPSAPDEAVQLEALLWQVEVWKEATSQSLETLQYGAPIPPSPHRLLQVLRAAQNHLRQHPEGKILIFATWYRTLLALKGELIRHYGTQAVAEFHCQVQEDALQHEADKFQSDARCFILLCDELGGEGRNFQIADLIIHVDLPWTPARLEQRIGRVDRLGREGSVVSVVPVARDQLEHDLFRIWRDAFGLFEHSLSGMEIALEQIQAELGASLARDSRNGFLEMLPMMMQRAKTLRQQVEEERYQEEVSRDVRQQQQFEQLGQRYKDGAVLRVPLLKWADMAGLVNTYKRETDTVRFYPPQFNLQLMRNVKFSEVPDMKEALLRSRHANSQWITGTFNRSIAVIQEHLVFFAPGSDPWTDAILKNVQEADRGRCCAIFRHSRKIAHDWRGFEFLYRVEPDPRMLYSLGLDPIHLLRAQGYLGRSTCRLFVSFDGSISSPGDEVFEAASDPFWRERDRHLGKRTGKTAQLARLKEAFPLTTWHEVLDKTVLLAKKRVQEEFSFAQEVAQKAEGDFLRAAAGQHARLRWLQANGQPASSADWAAVEQFELASSALVDAIRRPHYRLESICLWIIVPERE